MLLTIIISSKFSKGLKEKERIIETSSDELEEGENYIEDDYFAYQNYHSSDDSVEDLEPILEREEKRYVDAWLMEKNGKFQGKKFPIYWKSIAIGRKYNCRNRS